MFHKILCDILWNILKVCDVTWTMLVKLNLVMAATHHLWMEDVSAIVRLVKPVSTATPTSMNAKKVRTFVFLHLSWRFIKFQVQYVIKRKWKSMYSLKVKENQFCGILELKYSHVTPVIYFRFSVTLWTRRHLCQHARILPMWLCPRIRRRKMWTRHKGMCVKPVQKRRHLPGSSRLLRMCLHAR